MWEQILIKLQELDMWSMGIGIILTVATFFVYTQIGKYRKNKKQGK